MVQGKKEVKCIILRADINVLPMADESVLPFSSQEETLICAAKTLKAALMGTPNVDAAIKSSLSVVPRGTVLIPPSGPALASCDSFRITIAGKGSHVAWPEQGVDPPLQNGIFIYLKDLLGDDSREKAGGPAMGGEDFSNISNQCVGIQMALSAGSKAERHIYPPHNPKAFFIEDPMYIGTASLTCIGLRWLKDHP